MTIAQPVVFLDIDGVLAPFGRPDPRILDPGAVAQMRRVIGMTGARVVLASSWPEGVAREVLGDLGITIDDCLPDAQRGYDGRPRAIRHYLRKHKIARWMWIDDDSHPRAMQDGRPYPLDPARHVQPYWVDFGTRVRGEGFTADLADAAIRVLTQRLPIDREIEALKRAVSRHTIVVDDLVERWPSGACCPSCYFGAEYNNAVDKYRRAAHALIGLLKKRAMPGDIDYANAVLSDL